MLAGRLDAQPKFPAMHPVLPEWARPGTMKLNQVPQTPPPEEERAKAGTNGPPKGAGRG